jgi:TPP-dependent trihydroxycyclohexane-1,2-dione (THcHDO) dehydratase
MGWSTPAALGAKLGNPDKTVVNFTGDGSFGFNAMEIDTAVRHQAPVLIVVANNGAWQIEVHDQTDTHGKVVGTRLQLSDHAQMARAFGMHAERVERAEDLKGASSRPKRARPTASPGSPGCQTCSRSPPGMKRSAPGAMGSSTADLSHRAPFRRTLWEPTAA